jgi:hypothetical protein
VVIWIVLGTVLFGLLILALAARAVLARLARLRRATVPLLRRRAEAEALRHAAMELQERLLAVRAQAELAQRTVAVLRARRDGG